MVLWASQASPAYSPASEPVRPRRPATWGLRNEDRGFPASQQDRLRIPKPNQPGAGVIAVVPAEAWKDPSLAHACVGATGSPLGSDHPFHVMSNGSLEAFRVVGWAFRTNIPRFGTTQPTASLSDYNSTSGPEPAGIHLPRQGRSAHKPSIRVFGDSPALSLCQSYL